MADDIIEIQSEHLVDGQRVKVMKSKDDPMALRISAGGKKGLGFYINFRGNPSEIKECLHTVTKAFNEFQERYKSVH